MHISYAKGARTWERHIDINHDGVPVSPYCSLPEQADTWFKAFHKAAEMCGNSSESRRVIPKEEITYLDALVRGIYAKRDLKAGTIIDHSSFSEDFRLAVPLRKGQISTREIINGLKIVKDIAKNAPITIDDIDGPYASNSSLSPMIMNRGI
jgi:N-acetylneuraminate synthase